MKENCGIPESVKENFKSKKCLKTCLWPEHHTYVNLGLRPDFWPLLSLQPASLGKGSRYGPKFQVSRYPSPATRPVARRSPPNAGLHERNRFLSFPRVSFMLGLSVAVIVTIFRLRCIAHMSLSRFPTCGTWKWWLWRCHLLKSFNLPCVFD